MVIITDTTLFKENGRIRKETETASADPERKLFCPVCGQYFDVTAVVFGETRCPKCDVPLTDK